MYTSHQYALSAFRQVQEFLNENAEKVGTIRESEGGKLLDAAVAQIEGHGIDQSKSTLEIGGHVSLQDALEKELRRQHVLPIASFSRAQLRGVPEYKTLTAAVSQLKGHALVRAARAMAEAAAPYAERLVQGGFPSDVLAQLGQAADKLEASIDGRGTLKVRRATATKGIGEEVKRGHEAVKMLDALIERQFAKDETFLAGWRSAKKVATKPGVPRKSSVAAAPQS